MTEKERRDMSPDQENAQWKRIDQNSQRLDEVNREVGQTKKELEHLREEQSEIKEGFTRVEVKLDDALKAQERRSGAETLGRWVIGTAASLSAAVAAMWIWANGGGS
jgi:septal ring factor EnvC (AmiA/AmiB activator)